MGSWEIIVLWRGHFNATGSEAAANLTIYGGQCKSSAPFREFTCANGASEVLAASVWINDKFISSVYSTDDHVNHLFTFPDGAIVEGEDNVVTVVQDNMGLDEDDTEKSVRGINGFELVGGTFGTWKVQGKLGGYLKCAPLLSVTSRFTTLTINACAHAAIPTKCVGYSTKAAYTASARGGTCPGSTRLGLSGPRVSSQRACRAVGRASGSS